MYQVGSLITHNEIPDFNSLKNKVRAIFADVNQGETDADAGFGYGQDTINIVNDVLQGDIITAAQWNTLYSALYKCLRHQGTQSGLPTPEQVSVGDTIFAYNNLVSLVDLIEEERFRLSLNPAEYTVNQVDTSQRSTTWSGTAKHEFTLTFDDYDQARYYFNAGSSVNIQLSSSGSNPTPSDLLWDQVIGDGLNIQLFANHTTIDGVAESNTGFYDISEINTALVFTGVPGATLLVDARRTDYTATPFVVTVEVKLINVGDSTIPNPSTGTTYLLNLSGIDIGIFNRDTGTYTRIGSSGSTAESDLAYDGTHFWSIGYTEFPAPGVFIHKRQLSNAAVISSLGPYVDSGNTFVPDLAANALCNASATELFMVAGEAPPTLYRVNKDTGVRTAVATINGILRSAGDIVVDQSSNRLYGIGVVPVSSDTSQVLYSVDLSTNVASVGPTLELEPGSPVIVGINRIQGLIIDNGTVYGYSTTGYEFAINPSTGRLSVTNISPGNIRGAAHSSEALLSGVTPPDPCILNVSQTNVPAGSTVTISGTTGSAPGTYTLRKNGLPFAGAGPMTPSQNFSYTDTVSGIVEYTLVSPNTSNCAGATVVGEECIEWYIERYTAGFANGVFSSGTTISLEPNSYIVIYIRATNTPFTQCSLHAPKTMRVYQGSSTSGPEINLSGTSIPYPFVGVPFRTSGGPIANTCYSEFFIDPSDLGLSSGIYTIATDGCPQQIRINVIT